MTVRPFDTVRSARPTLLIGVGNRDRGDDAVGPIVCDLVGEIGVTSVRTVVLESAVVDLSTYWEPDDRAVVVDAARPNGRPGRITEFDAATERFAIPPTMSTHSIDLAGAVELARAMNRLPARLTIVAIEGESFEFGSTLSAPVRASAAVFLERFGTLAQAANPS